MIKKIDMEQIKGLGGIVPEISETLNQVIEYLNTQEEREQDILDLIQSNLDLIKLNTEYIDKIKPI